MSQDSRDLSTRAIHGPDPQSRKNRPVAPPIYLSATFESANVAEQIQLEESKADTFYTRYGNPTLSLVEKTMADLEGTQSAATFGSGMAAITTTLLALLKTGDHVVFQREIYGGAFRFASEFLPRYGVEVDWFDAGDIEGLGRALRGGTRLIYLEAPTNPTLKLVDLEAVAAIARRREVLTLIDATFASPYNLRPAEHGIDGVIHSATKYLGGHSDLLAGILAGSTLLVEQVKSTLRVFGGVLDPHAAYLLLRGLKTLGVRVEQQNRNALEMARFLEQHPHVARVYYPALESHPQHALGKRLMKGGGGVVSFEIVGSLETAKRFSDAVRLIRIAPSLGGVESLLSIPCLTSHAMLSVEDRQKTGIRDTLIRLALGAEASGDLIADVDQALAAAVDR